LLAAIEAGEAHYTFVEVMGCPGGCLGGGGQPRIKKGYQAYRQERQDAIYAIDAASAIRQSHNNPQIQKLYREYLGEPNGELSHKLLHTHYRNRQQVVHHTIKEIWDELKG